jgi:hypothetical protein
VVLIKEASAASFQNQYGQNDHKRQVQQVFRHNAASPKRPSPFEFTTMSVVRVAADAFVRPAKPERREGEHAGRLGLPMLSSSEGCPLRFAQPADECVRGHTIRYGFSMKQRGKKKLDRWAQFLASNYAPD